MWGVYDRALRVYERSGSLCWVRAGDGEGTEDEEVLVREWEQFVKESRDSRCFDQDGT